VNESAPTSTRHRGASPLLTVVPYAWLVVLTVLPVVLWHRVLGDILASFHWSLTYAAGELGPWLLLLTGVAFLVPVAVSVGLDPESRFYPRARRAYAGWGIVLYLLGLVLLVQVAELWKYTA
jgi:hypothetical protein